MTAGGKRISRAEVWAAATLAALGVATAVEALRTLAIGTVTRPAAGFFPLVTGAGLALIGGAVLVSTLRHPPGDSSTPDAPRATNRTGLFRATATLAALLLYAFALERAGFGVSTVVLILFLFRVIEPQPWPVALGGAVTAAAACHVLFRVWLGVRLPPGPFGF